MLGSHNNGILLHTPSNWGNKVGINFINTSSVTAEKLQLLTHVTEKPEYNPYNTGVLH